VLRLSFHPLDSARSHATDLFHLPVIHNLDSLSVLGLASCLRDAFLCENAILFTTAVLGYRWDITICFHLSNPDCFPGVYRPAVGVGHLEGA
jgi:hypothetical protein